MKSTVNVRRIFAHKYSMFRGPLPAHDFVVTCKGCHENLTTQIQTMPDDWIVETCPFCLETRRYLRQEIFRGRISHKYSRMRVPRRA